MGRARSFKSFARHYHAVLVVPLLKGDVKQARIDPKSSYGHPHQLLKQGEVETASKKLDFLDVSQRVEQIACLPME
jgi:hypothetical protein